MKKLWVMSLVLLATGCGALKVNPQGCKTDAIWGNSPNATRAVTREELVEEKIIGLKARERYYVFFDRDLKIRDLLAIHGIRCEEVKKLRVEIATKWFFQREVSLKVVKN